MGMQIGEEKAEERELRYVGANIGTGAIRPQATWTKGIGRKDNPFGQPRKLRRRDLHPPESGIIRLLRQKVKEERLLSYPVGEPNKSR